MVLSQARWLSCMIRFGLRLSIEFVFIPHGRPQRNGAIEYFNGYKITANYRCGKLLRKLPAGFSLIQSRRHRPSRAGFPSQQAVQVLVCLRVSGVYGARSYIKPGTRATYCLEKVKNVTLTCLAARHAFGVI
jgi:hypothetical protein